jgi:hypothetical protein
MKLNAPLERESLAALAREAVDLLSVATSTR